LLSLAGAENSQGVDLKQVSALGVIAKVLSDNALKVWFLDWRFGRDGESVSLVGARRELMVNLAGTTNGLIYGAENDVDL
jgi:hypothetical protein